MKKKKGNIYTDKILEIIRNAKSVPNFSLTDYIDPIRDLYLKLSSKQKKKFLLSILELLQGKDYLGAIIDICSDLKLKEAGPLLVKMFLEPPKNLKEDGYPIWIEGLRISILVSLGELGYKEAKTLLISLLDEKIFKKWTLNLPKFKNDIYGIIIQVLTKLSPKDASKYFGWWLRKAQGIDDAMKTMVKGVEDWKIMEKMNIAPNIDDIACGTGASSVRISLFNIVRRDKLKGLEKWLKSISLIKSEDRKYLCYQLAFLLEGKDEFFNLKQFLRIKGDTKLLADKLSSLPKIRK